MTHASDDDGATRTLRHEACKDASVTDQANHETDSPADTAEQAAFRAEVRSFLAANAKPKRDVSMWAVNFHTDPAEAAAEFENGRAWQKTLFDNGFAGLTYPK